MVTKQIILEALGEASALFMSQECKGTEIVMPSEELIRIADAAAEKIDESARFNQDFAVHDATSKLQ